MRFSTKIAKITRLAIALTCTGALMSTTVLLDPAMAKSEDSKDKGSKDKTSKDKSKKAKAKKKSEKKKVGSTKPKKVKKATVKKSAPQTVALASEPAPDIEEELSNGLKIKNIRAALGALNAANASEQAFANASPNSRVGKISAYRDQVLANEELCVALADAIELHDLLEAPDLTPEEYAAAVAASEARQVELEAQIAELEAVIETSKENPDLADELTATMDALEAERAQTTGLVDPRPYYESEQALKLGEEKLKAQQDLASELLEAAANKTVTEEVVEEVHRMLNLPTPRFPEDISHGSELVVVSE